MKHDFQMINTKHDKVVCGLRDPFKAQGTPMDFNVTEHEKFTGRVQTTVPTNGPSGNHHWLDVGVIPKQKIIPPNSSLFRLYFRLRWIFFVHVTRNHVLPETAYKDRRTQPSSAEPDVRGAKMQSSATLPSSHFLGFGIYLLFIKMLLVFTYNGFVSFF